VDPPDIEAEALQSTQTRRGFERADVEFVPVRVTELEFAQRCGVGEIAQVGQLRKVVEAQPTLRRRALEVPQPWALLVPAEVDADEERQHFEWAQVFQPPTLPEIDAKEAAAAQLHE